MAKLFFKNEGKIKMLWDNKKLREFSVSRFTYSMRNDKGNPLGSDKRLLDNNSKHYKEKI